MRTDKRGTPASSSSSPHDLTIRKNADEFVDEAPSSPESSPPATGASVDGLLSEIYQRFRSHASRSIDSDNLTECSSSSTYPAGQTDTTDRLDLSFNLNEEELEKKSVQELKRILRCTKRLVTMRSSKLVRSLKSRDRNASKLQKNFDVLTAILQALSLKRREDTIIRFSFTPHTGGIQQWLAAYRMIARLRGGIPSGWRRNVWLRLAEYYLGDIDWAATLRFCFNVKRNPDDHQLGVQIVKDLHRTGCSWFFAESSAEDRASLQRVLLAYARWNKSVGYCQGFNIIAALVLQIMDGNEYESLKVMIYLVDRVLPKQYFSNNLRALSVDMVVFRDLLSCYRPVLAKHLDRLQGLSVATQSREGPTTSPSSVYEPPLMNVFTMQWFLTLFATCLPHELVLRIWDSILLEGSEVLMRVALTLWDRMSSQVLGVSTASDFYTVMGDLLQRIMNSQLVRPDQFMNQVYGMASFPLPGLADLRERYLYNINPFSYNRIDSVTFLEDREKSGSKRSSLRMVLESAAGRKDSMNRALSTSREVPVVTTAISIPSSASVPTSTKKTLTEATLGWLIGASKPAQGPVGPPPPQGQRFSGSAESSAPPSTVTADLHQLKQQYRYMRDLQKHAMLIFSSPDADDDVEQPINHLFLVSERSRNFVRTSDPHSIDSGEGGSLVGRPLSTSSCIKSRVMSKDGGCTVSAELSFEFSRVDKTALYPANFQPFPVNNVSPASKLLVGK